ncbi:MAG: tetratricopeptide repeat protein [Planctomycetota bacterium]|nr:tetratricopeptide repeat protein [Planctomycetota bacterium]
MTTAALMRKALQKHQAGDLDSAGRMYSEILEKNPADAEAWHLAGVLSHQMGQGANSIAFMKRAIELNDQIPSYYLNLATSLIEQDKASEAKQVIERGLQIDPKSVLAWNVLGVSHLELANYPAAEEALKRAAELSDGSAEPACNLCQLYFKIGDLDASLRWGRKALESDPDYYQAINNLASTYRGLQRFEEAKEHFERAIVLAAGKIDKDMMLSLRVNLCGVLASLGLFADAEKLLIESLEQDPCHGRSWNALGQLCLEMGRPHEATKCFQKAVEINAEDRIAVSNLLYGLNVNLELDRQQQLKTHVALTSSLPRRANPTFHNNRNPNRKLRIGYVSADFRKHAMYGFLTPILKQHDRSQFEIFGYSEVQCPDQTTVEYSRQCDGWLSTVGLHGSQIQQAIESDRIDILIDLTGHTAGNRLDIFALKSAPVQVSMIGYLNTTGLPEMNYYISDEIRDPAAEDHYYTEEVVRLPSGGIAWLPPKEAPDVGPSPWIENDLVTFGSTHRLNKMNDHTLNLWSTVLKRVPDSRLLLFRNDFLDSEDTQARTLTRLHEAGLPEDRVFLAWDSERKYLHAYNAFDILLECIPWASGTTALESLWMGVPIPTLYGDRPSCRPTASALNRVGMKELVAYSDEEYVDIVAKLAADRERISELRTVSRERMRETICNPGQFIQELEATYRQMWERWCHGE